MSTPIPKAVLEDDNILACKQAGLKLIHQGKVRAIFELPGYLGLLLMVMTNRVSIFDFVLRYLVPRKGEVLTATTVFWLTQVFRDIKNHLVAFGRNIDDYLPNTLQRHPLLRARAVVVKELEIVPVEFIVRGYLTGSAWRAYQNGNLLPGMTQDDIPSDPFNGIKLVRPVFTPTTKAKSGHDMPISPEEVADQYGSRLANQSVQLFEKAAVFAREHGLELLDTKFEWSVDGTLADEVFTPDSSRFALVEDLEAATEARKPPPAYDKELVRAWGLTVETPFGVTGLNKLDPANIEHVEFAHSLSVPNEIIEKTTERSLRFFGKLTGMSLDKFQRNEMGVV